MSTLTVVHLGQTFLQGPNISHELHEAIRATLAEKKKVLLFFNRRGYGRAVLCEDCGYHWKCPYCDISFSYHTAGGKRLLCHHCNAIAPFPFECPNCHGNNILVVGIGIQQIENSLHELFPSARIVRVDSDTKKVEKHLEATIRDADIIIGTQMAVTTANPSLGLIAFLLLDSELTIPEYNIEERIYLQCAYAIKQGTDVILQTYMQDAPLLEHLLSGNYRSFLTETLHDRKKYGYPPYGELVTLYIRDIHKEKVVDIITKLANKIRIFLDTFPEKDGIFFTYDRDIWERRGEDWIQKIVLKGPDISLILEHIRIELVRNPQVMLERK